MKISVKKTFYIVLLHCVINSHYAGATGGYFEERIINLIQNIFLYLPAAKNSSYRHDSNAASPTDLGFGSSIYKDLTSSKEKMYTTLHQQGSHLLIQALPSYPRDFLKKCLNSCLDYAKSEAKDIKAFADSRSKEAKQLLGEEEGLTKTEEAKLNAIVLAAEHTIPQLHKILDGSPEDQYPPISLQEAMKNTVTASLVQNRLVSQAN